MASNGKAVGTNGKPNGKAGAHGVPVDFDANPTAAMGNRIRKFSDIPDIQTMDVPSVDWLVPEWIARRTITLWAGSGGAAKTFLTQSLGVAVATGGLFLGRRCQQWPVLMLDYENAAFMVKDRLSLMADGPIDSLRIWGTWNAQPPPRVGNEVLFDIAKEMQPLIIVDPLRLAHGCKENDSTEMAGVMQQLRFCTSVGATVVIVHHVAKSEGSTGRGSTVIEDLSEANFTQEVAKDATRLITLRSSKLRFGPNITVTIKPNFEEGTFQIVDSPEFTQRSDDMNALRKIIEEEPGLSQNAMYEKAGMNKNRMTSLLRAGNGSLWEERKEGSYKTAPRHYFPLLGACSGNADQAGNNRNKSTTGACSVDPHAFKRNKGTSASDLHETLTLIPIERNKVTKGEV